MAADRPDFGLGAYRALTGPSDKLFKLLKTRKDVGLHP
jgi:hypothetical protein